MSTDEMDSWGAPTWERDGVEHVAFETRREAEQYVATALGSEVDPDDFDVAAIARDCFVFDPATNADGTVHLNRQGLRLAATTEEFWASVQRNERSGR